MLGSVRKPYVCLGGKVNDKGNWRKPLGDRDTDRHGNAWHMSGYETTLWEHIEMLQDGLCRRARLGIN